MRKLQLPSLKFRRLRGDLIQTYKIFNGLDDIDKEHFFTLVSDERTRNSFQKIFIKQATSNIRKNSFSNRIAPIWNKLTKVTKTAKNNLFKDLLEKEKDIMDKMFEYDA